MCGPQCFELGPPPNSILSMPPPPLPAFLLPRSALVASITANESEPCFAAFMCDSAPGPREQPGIEFIELSGRGLEDTWLFIIVTSCVAVILLGTILAYILMKYRDSYDNVYQDNTRKQGPMEGMCTERAMSAEKPQPFIPGNILYPCPSNTQTLQQQLVKENRMLWATLTPHGTKHLMSNGEPFSNSNYEDHYEVIDYQMNRQPTPSKIREATLKRIPVKSFDNTGFTDFDYEDFNNIADLYHDDHDSGYQEPQEVIGTINRNGVRPLVSSPTRIEHPNIPPLNIHPHYRSHNTLNRKSTLSRRTTDSLSAYGPSNN